MCQILAKPSGQPRASKTRQKFQLGKLKKEGKKVTTKTKRNNGEKNNKGEIRGDEGYPQSNVLQEGWARCIYSLRGSLFLLPLRRSLFGLFLLLLGLATRVGRITAGRNVTLLTILLLALTTSATARFRWAAFRVWSAAGTTAASTARPGTLPLLDLFRFLLVFVYQSECKFIQNRNDVRTAKKGQKKEKAIVPICLSSFLLDFVLSPWRTSVLEGFISSFFSLSSLLFFSSFSLRLCFLSLSFSLARLRLSLSRLSSLRSFWIKQTSDTFPLFLKAVNQICLH